MQAADVRSLVDYTYWVNHRLLDAAARLPPDLFLSGAGPTTRDLRATLVHELDVEWSWRLRMQGLPPEEWGPQAELLSHDFADVASLRERWSKDEAEMRDWISSLSDDDLAAMLPAAGATSRPLWQYLMHVFTHAMQQQADAATLLTAAGCSPGNLEFLTYLADRS